MKGEDLLLDDLHMFECEIQAVDTVPGDTMQTLGSLQGKTLQDCDKFDTALVKKRVDASIIMQAKNCRDYVACKTQIRELFEVILLDNLRIYEGPETTNRPTFNPLELHKLVKQFDCPNFLGARIPVVSNLNIDRWNVTIGINSYWTYWNLGSLSISTKILL